MTFKERILLLPKENEELLVRALPFAEKAYSGHTRVSGTLYLEHALQTAEILLDVGAGAETITAGLLHDAIDHGNTTQDEIEKEFGASISGLVYGSRELSKIKYRGSKRHAESLRKFFIVIAKNPKVILVKMATRLDTMRTLGDLGEEDRLELSQETLELYAPLAERLGMGLLRGELEDLSFKHTNPQNYALVSEMRAKKSTEAKEFIDNLGKELALVLKKNDVITVSVDARIKHIYSFYKKLLRNDMDPDRIHDVVAMRVLVESVSDCYRVLGLVHEKWTPLLGKIKDYIARPKSNGYQSLHTTVEIAPNSFIEFQIRTKEMHDYAEYGFAAHSDYVAKNKPKPGSQLKDEWLGKILDWVRTGSKEEELEIITKEMLAERIFVFTPMHEVVELPEGATVLDFAFAVHSALGLRTTGARVNEKFVSLDTKLKSGDLVLVETKKGGKPSKKWLEIVRTNTAQKAIRGYFKEK